MTDRIQEMAEQQRAYWNSPEGEKWVNNQTALDRMLVPMTEVLLKNANIKTGENILDVGCGAGTTTRILGARVGASGQVLGVDISAPLMSAAKAQANDEDEHVQYLEGDAGSVHEPMRDVDLIFSRFGVMFFADPAQAFAHMRKVLKPEGRLCFVCWGFRQDNPWFGYPYDVVTGRLGALDPVPQRTPGPMAYAEVDYIQEFLSEARFNNISVETSIVQLIGSENALKTAEFLMSFGPGARVLSNFDVDEHTRQQLIIELAERLKPFMLDDCVQVPAKLHYVCATHS